MQVRHIEVEQLQLEKVEKTQPQLMPPYQEDKPWEEVVECLAVIAAIHALPCQAAAGRKDEEDKEKPSPPDDEPKPT
ncbi:MAG: hypothetical protein L0Y71_11745 [Gemmataceae bacterium]|nr:hypothetical protein [Gemmataceae bacterium]